eukprot:scaffold21796_cov75-Skeletonema_dohrnii-CCMP3373.AAC.1
MVSVKHIMLRSCALVFVVVMASISQMHSLVHKEHLAFQCIHSASIARSRRTASDHYTTTSSGRIIKPSLLHMSSIAPNQDNSTSQTVSKRKR